MRVSISTIETYLPSKIVTNHDLSKTLDTSDEWIRTRTGIGSRHIAANDEFASDLGTKAALKIFENTDLSPLDIDAIIVATSTSDHRFPSCAVKIQHNIGAFKAFAFDVQAACSGFIYALSTAESFIKSNKANKILLIGVDTLSKFVDWTDRATCVLFGDGAGACIIEKCSDDSSGIIATKLYSDGSKHNFIIANQGPQNNHRGYLTMAGRPVFKNAIECMHQSIKEIMDENNMTYDDIDWIIPHQANRRIIESMSSMKNIPMEKIIISIEDHANTSSASIPLALKEEMEKGRIKKGQIILITALGAGLVWGSALIKL